MSLTKLLKAPIKLFKKDVITFLVIRRYDLGIINDELHYIAMKPTASINTLRRKVWHLLELPDYCDEIIVLKTANDVEIPLTELRRGNNPQHPYILEVWLPDNSAGDASTTILNNMLTMGQSDSANNNTSDDSICEKEDSPEKTANRSPCAQYTTSTETIAQIKHNVSNTMYPKAKAAELSCKFSKTSLFKIGGKRHENFATILMKIQSELSVLNTKIAVLENKLKN